MSIPGGAGRPRRPARLTPGMMDVFASESLDPAVIVGVADESAAALVHAGRASDDPDVTRRLVEIVDEIGLSTLAELWAQRPARSLPGLLWRLYVLREWVRRDPAGASADYAEGLRFADVAGVVAGEEVVGLLGRPVVIKVGDSRSTAQPGVEAATKLIELDGAVGIIGCAESSCTVAVATSTTVPKGIPMISPSATAASAKPCRISLSLPG